MSGMKKVRIPTDWSDAFFQLAQFIKESKEEKKVIFIDEVPWLDTPRSGFLSALEYFWNSFASARKDVLLIICGSATSWIINKVLKTMVGCTIVLLIAYTSSHSRYTNAKNMPSI